MKSKTSYFNKTIFMKNLTHFWPIWVSILAWNLFIMPFMIYNASIQYAAGNRDYLSQADMMQQRANDILSLVQVYAEPILIFIFAVGAAMAVFSYLYNSRAANAMHALPVTRIELFLTNYISGLLFLLIPQLVGFLAGTLVSAMCGYTSMNYLLTGLLLAWGSSFFFYSFTVFVAMFTGQLFAVPIFTLILNLLFVGCKTILNFLMSYISYGITLRIQRGRWDFLSPLFYISGKVNLNWDYSSEYAVCQGITGLDTIACFALVAVALVVLAYLVYRKRDMETAGSLISFSFVSPIFRWGVASCVGIFLGVCFNAILEPQTPMSTFVVILVFTVVFGTIGFFAAQMLLEKGFRVFQKKRFMECGIFLIVLLFLLVGIELDLFGQEKKVPDAAEVEYAYIDSNYIAGGSDSETIDQIIKVHRQIISSKKEFESFLYRPKTRYEDRSSAPYCYTTIQYNLKNGSSLQRSYMVPIDRSDLENPDTVFGQMAELNIKPEMYIKYLFCENYDEIKMLSGTFTTETDDENYEAHDLSTEEAEKIYQAVLADIREGNFKEYIYNRYFYDEEYDQSAFVDTISLEFSCKGEIRSVFGGYSRTVYGYGASQTGYSDIGFDRNCKNIIAALEDIGVIQSEADLTTFDQQVQKE